jgi:HTH-type transcriptional regulator / antitoxin HigA
MNIKLIKTEEDYNEALKRVYELWDAEPGTPEGDESEVLYTLVEAYEKKHYPIEKPDPIEAIKFRLDQMGLTEKDLSKILGSRSRKHDILSGKRKLSLKMIRKLNETLKIPAEVLIAAF